MTPPRDLAATAPRRAAFASTRGSSAAWPEGCQALPRLGGSSPPCPRANVLRTASCADRRAGWRPTRRSAQACGSWRTPSRGLSSASRPARSPARP
eukprot:9768688-Lingulodinium_polyedra.AAC.1